MAGILVVEHDLSVRPLLKEALRPLGREILWAATVEEGKGVLECYRCDLVISGLLPAGKARGLDLYLYCQKRYPDLPFVVVFELPGDLFEELLSIGVPCPPFVEKGWSVNQCRMVIEPFFFDSEQEQAA